MDVLVVSGCSGSKRFDDPPIGCAELDTTPRSTLLEQYPAYTASAAAMYTGAEHDLVESAVTQLRSVVDVSWTIVSAGYGVVDETDDIVAYECTFSDRDSVRRRANRFGFDVEDLTHDEQLQAIANQKDIPTDLRRRFNSVDLVLVVLSTPYLTAIADALDTNEDDVTVMAFAANSGKPYLGDAYWVPATEEVRKRLETSWFRIRGELLTRLAATASEQELAQLVKDPERITELNGFDALLNVDNE